jgi:hypothetical protein
MKLILTLHYGRKEIAFVDTRADFFAVNRGFESGGGGSMNDSCVPYHIICKNMRSTRIPCD